MSGLDRDNSHTMALINLLNAQLAFGHVALLDHANFSLEPNERIGLIGRNGAGKSSLLKILGGLAHADDGTVQMQQGVRVAYVAQELIFGAASPEETEDLRVRRLPFAEVLEMVLNGEITDALSMIAILKTNEWLKRGVLVF